MCLSLEFDQSAIISWVTFMINSSRQKGQRNKLVGDNSDVRYSKRHFYFEIVEGKYERRFRKQFSNIIQFGEEQVDQNSN